MTLTAVILYSIFFALLTALIASRKGYKIRDWFWLGLFLGIIATGIILFQPKKERDS